VNDRIKLLAYRIFDPTKAPLQTKKPVDLTPEIATRAYELYQQRVRGKACRTRTDWKERRMPATIRRRMRRPRRCIHDGRCNNEANCQNLSRIEQKGKQTMNIDSNDFRVPSCKKVDLSKWPTIVKPYCRRKAMRPSFAINKARV
jgi:hypothetical protein